VDVQSHAESKRIVSGLLEGLGDAHSLAGHVIGLAVFTGPAIAHDPLEASAKVSTLEAKHAAPIASLSKKKGTKVQPTVLVERGKMWINQKGR
jgi:hypothetical protein